MLDKDMDGRLSDLEMSNLQEIVFSSNLSDEDLRGIKDIIKEELRDISNERGVTLEGFIIVNRRMIEMMKIKNCWIILKKFGFNENLDLSESSFSDKLLGLESGKSVELGNDAMQFLRKVFCLFSANGLSLSLKEINDIFFPIDDQFIQNFDYESLLVTEYDSIQGLLIPLQSWILFWAYLTHEDYAKAFRYLKYIGYRNGLSEAFLVTNRSDSLKELGQSFTRDVLKIA